MKPHGRHAPGHPVPSLPRTSLSAPSPSSPAAAGALHPPGPEPTLSPPRDCLPAVARVAALLAGPRFAGPFFPHLAVQGWQTREAASSRVDQVASTVRVAPSFPRPNPVEKPSSFAWSCRRTGRPQRPAIGGRNGQQDER